MKIYLEEGISDETDSASNQEVIRWSGAGSQRTRWAAVRPYTLTANRTCFLGHRIEEKTDVRLVINSRVLVRQAFHA